MSQSSINNTYPSNIGSKWTNKEDETLLEEIANNISFQEIALNHKRTTGGIHARRREIAYKMHLEYDSMEEIIKKTKLSEEEIALTINRRANAVERKHIREEIRTKTNITERKQEQDEVKINKKDIDLSEIKSELTTMRSEIFELKKTVNELAEMLKLVYEFETE
jgi:hypothetical protein